MTIALSRRHLFGLAAAAGATVAFGAAIPRLAGASGGRDPRLVVIVLRGALDGLTAVPPIGDPDFAGLRTRFETAAPLPLDAMFALHPSMPNLARQYKAGQAAVIHASATAYRDRSHFDGQDVLESGFAGPGHTDSGWLNRFLSGLPSDQQARVTGLAGGSLTPLTLRGPAHVLGWSPANLSVGDGDLTPRLMALYGQTDPVLAQTLDEAVRTGKIAAGYSPASAAGGLGDHKVMVALAGGVAKLLAANDGPRVAAMALDGWDTHAAEVGRLNDLLGGLDAALATFETTLGPVWRDTAILVVTEFGRTIAINGTGGTDHGTAAAAFLTGGAVKGGRVIADWPGLKTGQLYQARDLMPTTDLRGICKGLLTELYDTPESALATTIFPDSAAVKPFTGLIA